VTRAALVGTGHVGGSLLLAWRRAGAIDRAIGCDVSPVNAARALERGIVDELAERAGAAVDGADLVVLATPVAAMEEVAREIASALSPRALVIDVGSVKAPVVAAVERALPGARYVGCHPIAGVERAGPDAADADLFRGRFCLLTPTARTPPDAVDQASDLWRAAGARVERISPERHDRLLARTSHLPHAAAFALAAALDDAVDPSEIEEAALFGGTSLRDTTRVAASDAAMWRDIFVANAAELLPLIDSLAATATALRNAIADGDGAAIVDLVERARRARARLVRE